MLMTNTFEEILEEINRLRLSYGGLTQLKNQLADTIKLIDDRQSVYSNEYLYHQAVLNLALIDNSDPMAVKL